MKIHSETLNKLSMGTNIYVMHNGIKASYPIVQPDCYTAAYIARGAGTLETGGKSFPAEESNIFLIGPDTPYRFVPHAGTLRIEVYCCYFTVDSRLSAAGFPDDFCGIDEFYDGKTPFIRALDNDRHEIRSIFIQMISEQMSSAPYYKNALYGLLTLLLARLNRNIVKGDYCAVFSKNTKVDMAIRYIQHNLYSHISLNTLAHELSLSPSMVCRLFKKYVGMSTSQYITKLRVEKIKDIIENTDKPIDSIAVMFSYSPDYIRRMFKTETGMTMNEYHSKYNYKFKTSYEAT